MEEGKTIVASDQSDYSYMVVDKGKNPAEVKEADSVVNTENVELEGSDNDDLKENVKTAITKIKPSVDEGVLNTAAKTVANANTETPDMARNALTAAKVTVDNNTPVFVVVQPYLQISLKKVSVADDDKSFTLDITPMYRKVATTADPSNNVEIVTQDDDPNKVNAVQIDQGKLNIINPVKVTIPLPDKFLKGECLYVTHTKENGQVCIYTGTVSDNTLTFKNPDGFSEFKVSTKNDAVAKIDEVGYKYLQDAVDAVKDNQTIELLAGGTAIVNGDKKFTVIKGKYTYDITAANGYTIATTDNENGTIFYTVTAVSNGGSSSGSDAAVTSNTVTSASAANGTVSVSPKTAAKGTTVTVTVKPNDGYAVDKVTVTDKNDAAVAVTRKSDTEYTFIMPDSAVTVNGTFAKKDASLAFTDVKDSDYFSDAVEWAVQNGITSGTTPTTFSPYNTCTRAQAVTFLYRLAGSPTVDQSVAAKFTDVPEGKWYADAVAWALANGITSGTTASTFSPDDPCTRGQAMTFLYRYEDNPASTKGITFSDVTPGMFCADAVSWAAENGITVGTTPATFSPDASCPRAQIITFLYRNMTK